MSIETKVLISRGVVIIQIYSLHAVLLTGVETSLSATKFSNQPRMQIRVLLFKKLFKI